MGEGGGGRNEWLVCALRPVKNEETVSHRHKNNAKEVGEPASAKQLVYSATWIGVSVSKQKTQG